MKALALGIVSSPSSPNRVAHPPAGGRGGGQRGRGIVEKVSASSGVRSGGQRAA